VKIFNKVCDAEFGRNVKVKVYEKPSFEFTTDPLVIIYQEGIKVPMPVMLTSPASDTLTETRWSNETWLEFQTANRVNPLIVPKREQTELTYSLYVKTGPQRLLNCSAERSIVVINALPLLIPNAFSPNGDGVNDTWVINGLNKYSNVTVSVFNRWGNKVFYSTGAYTPWDGTVNGIPMSSGTYYAIVELKGSPDNEDGNFTKALTIVR
jgi:gliding motility-associated-like protein